MHQAQTPSHSDTHPCSGQPILWTPDEQLARPGCALLVIDMQNDFIGENGLLARRGLDPALQRGILGQVNRLVSAARQAAVPVIWVRTTHTHADSPPNYLAVHLRDIHADRWNPSQLLVEEGSQGAQWHPGLAPREEHETEIVKTMYSAFRGTRLHQILAANGIRTLILAGCNTNVCIHTTAADAFFEGYYPVLCEDACATASEATHQAILATHRMFYGLTASVDGIRDAWSEPGPARAQRG